MFKLYFKLYLLIKTSKVASQSQRFRTRICGGCRTVEQGRAPSDSTFPPGWNPETRCYVCGVNRTPYELARHMKRAHLEASQANVGVGDRLYRRPPVRLPHCGTCKLFIGYGSDYAELHRQTELYQYRARKFPGRPSDSDVATETGRRGGVSAAKRQASPSMERASPGGGSAGDARQYEDQEGPEAFSPFLAQSPNATGYIERTICRGT